jgi:hypothetical protein
MQKRMAAVSVSRNIQRRPNMLSMKNFSLLLAIGLLPLAVVAHAALAPSVIQFRLVVDSPTADSEQMTIAQPNNPSRQPEVLNVQKAVLLDRSDLESAKFGAQISGVPDNVPGPVIISIKFTDAGAKRLAEVTRQSIGKRLAIVIDGKLVSAPQINTAITGGAAEITGNFTKEEARTLATEMNGSPAHEVLTWSRIGFYCFAPLFAAATGIVVWRALRQKNASPAA